MSLRRTEVKSHVYRDIMEAGLYFSLGAICAVSFVRTMYVLERAETRPLWAVADITQTRILLTSETASI